jgi:curli biogenesis system outer membrane secretion channel CsgG
MSVSFCRAICAALCLVLAATWPAEAQQKIRIAIWEVTNNAEHTWSFWGEMGPAARNQIDTEFSENPTLSAKFSIVERDKLNLVMKEQGLATSGALDPQSAAKVGKLLGVKYIVVGGIDKFAINDTKGNIRGFGGNLQQASATVNIRFVDTTTGERVLAMSADGEVRKGGGFTRSISGGRDAQWGIASEAIQKASKAAVAKFATAGYLERLEGASAPVGGLEVHVVKIEGNRVWINAGSASGVKAGDTFSIFSLGEALIDPVSGANLGADEKQTGSASVNEVQEKYAIATVTGSIKAKDVLRKK